MSPQARLKHAELTLAAIVAEATQLRLSDAKFREYVLLLTDSMDLPRP